jgi:hypothetical protein
MIFIVSAKRCNRIIRKLSVFLFLFPFGCGINLEEGKLAKSCEDHPKPLDAWVFPVKPGTKEWLDLLTSEARLKASQIPVDILKEMSTDALIQSWLDFPLNIDVFLTNNPNYAIDFYIKNFNGLEELVKRPNGALRILNRYEKMDPNCALVYNDTGQYSLSFPIIELLLSQNVVLEKLSHNEKKEIVREALVKYELKRRHSNIFGDPNGSYSLLVCLQVMVQSEYLPILSELEDSRSDQLLNFHNSGILIASSYKSPEANVILEHSRKFSR